MPAQLTPQRLNHYSWWQNALILLVLAFGVFYSLPNFFRPQAAIQVRAESSRQQLGVTELSTVQQSLSAAGIAFEAAQWDDGGFLLPLMQDKDQLRARELAEKVLGAGHVVALNRADTTPDWLSSMGGQPMSLGLDLSGGVHFLLQVDTQSHLSTLMKNWADELRRTLRAQRLRVVVDLSPPDEQGGYILLRAGDDERLQALRKLLADDFSELRMERSGGDSGLESELGLRLDFSPERRREYIDYAVEQNLGILRNRVNELGVAEPLVQRQGRSRIVVELPGVQDTAQAKRVLGKFANLEFRLEALASSPPLEREFFRFRDASSSSEGAWLLRSTIVKGESVTGASPGYDENSQPAAIISLDSLGGAAMNQASRNNVGRRMGVLFIERRTRTAGTSDLAAALVDIGEKYQSKELISLAVIRSALGSRFQITGLDSPAEAAELSLLLRAGALSAPLEFIEERTVGPSLGAENVAKGLRSVQIGLLLVLLFMVAWYQLFGIAASLALVANLSLLVALMSLLSATLTLPGIAGMVLTVGMAVDANVLIYSRIREELIGGLSPQRAIHAGYERAMTTILDANLTTLLVALILYIVGTGPVRGFAVTLSLGIISSLFCSIFLTRAVVNGVYGGRRIKHLHLGWPRNRAVEGKSS